MKDVSLQPTQADLGRVFRQKHGDPETTGWSPRRRFRFGYFTPDEYYEAVVAKLVEASEGCAWIDVGGGRAVFPDNPELARALARRCRALVGVDPSDTLDENPFVHRRVKSPIEDFGTLEKFDLATLRMVAEHIADPGAAAAALARLLRPGGKVVIYTVNQFSPVSIASWVMPFWLHHPIKRLVWNTEEKDTFPVCYRMNTRGRLSRLFGRYGFRECYFAHLDDCRTFACSRVLNLFELWLWRALKGMKMTYPENCLLGVYERVSRDP